MSPHDTADSNKFILDHYFPSILNCISSCLQDNDGDHKEPNKYDYEFSCVECIPSAQHCVLLLTYDPTTSLQSSSSTETRTTTRNDDTTNNAHFPNVSNECHNVSPISLSKKTQTFLQTGNGRLIVRIWKNGCRWWNLHSNHTIRIQHSEREGEDILTKQQQAEEERQRFTIQLAQAEVIGYRILQTLVQQQQQQKEEDSSTGPSSKNGSSFLNQPHVLFFSHEDSYDHAKASITSLPYPWAVFSYVGEHSHSIYYEDLLTSPSNSHTYPQWKRNSSFIDRMIRERYEFGFLELHPRHGRVCIEQCVDYVIHVFDVLVLPLHKIFFDLYYLAIRNDLTSSDPKQIIDWIHKLQQIQCHQPHKNNYNDGGIIQKDTNEKNDNRSDLIDYPCPIRFGDMIEMYDWVTQNIFVQLIHQNDTFHDSQLDMDNFQSTIHLLQKYIHQLYQDQNVMKERGEYDSLPGVLCHMDLQPQNMIFRQRDKSSEHEQIPLITSVLDWEECCFADPRFEILMLCRKVVSNREQADSIWEYYVTHIDSSMGHHQLSKHVGSIEPWLRLESVHSIITLLLQACHLHGGGRNPWETHSELWGKIQREVVRLVSFGPPP